MGAAQRCSIIVRVCVLTVGFIFIYLFNLFIIYYNLFIFFMGVTKIPALRNNNRLTADEWQRGNLDIVHSTHLTNCFLHTI